MRNSLFLVALIVTSLASGCLTDNNISCTNEVYIPGLEYLYVENNGNPYLTQYSSATTGFSLCEQITPPDSVTGFNNIYTVEATLKTDCNAGDCIQVYEYGNPYCPVTFEYSDEEAPLVGKWAFVRLINQDTLYPSCNVKYLEWWITSVSESVEHNYINGAIGVNDISIGMVPLENNKFVIDYRWASDEPAVPYIEYLEGQLIEFFASSDTISYAIERNTMSLSSPDSTLQLLLYHPTE